MRGVVVVGSVLAAAGVVQRHGWRNLRQVSEQSRIGLASGWRHVYMSTSFPDSNPEGGRLLSRHPWPYQLAVP